VQYRLGQILERAGRVADARAAYQQAIASDPALKAAREALEKLKG
jgi:Flp pilus assembly protein TadD